MGVGSKGEASGIQLFQGLSSKPPTCGVSSLTSCGLSGSWYRGLRFRNHVCFLACLCLFPFPSQSGSTSWRLRYLWDAQVVWYLGKRLNIINALSAYSFHFKALLRALLLDPHDDPVNSVVSNYHLSSLYGRTWWRKVSDRPMPQDVHTVEPEAGLSWLCHQPC